MFTAVICDDDIIFAEQFKNFLIENQINVLAAAINGIDAKKIIQTYKPQVIFINIDMPKLDGLTLAKFLKRQFPEIIIIFVTGHVNYASEAFNLEATDYLLKPLVEERIYDCLHRIQQKLTNKDKSNNLLIKVKSGYKVIDENQILYITSENKLTKIFLTERTSKPILTYETLKNIEKRINKQKFIRTHKSYIVNIEQIDKIEPSGQTNLIFLKIPHTYAYLSKGYTLNLFKKLK